MTVAIEVKNLHKAFGKQKILRGVDLTFEEGEITVIIGKSGTGKSVLIKNMIGLLKPDQGEILYHGDDISTISSGRLLEVRKDFGFLFQNAALFDSMNVEENISFPLIEIENWKDKQKINDKVAQMLDLVSLPGIQKQYPSELSGGMRKRVGLARALVLRPKVMYFDEPTTGLDPMLAQSIDELIVKVNKEFGITCIVISHDISATFRIADKIAFLYEGVIEFTGDKHGALAFQHPVMQKFIENTFNRDG